MKKIILSLSLALAGVVIWGVHLAMRAHSKRVTLNVRNADLAAVVRKLEWQTWETIFVKPGITAQITLNVHDVPLDAVLNLIAEQASARWTSVYPVYSTGASLAAFKKSVRGEVDPAVSGWSNYVARIPGGRNGFGGFGGFGGGARDRNSFISVHFTDKSLDVAELALDRFGQGRLIAEDGVGGTVQLNVDKATMPQAVAEVARQVHRHWKHYYVVETMRNGRRPALARDDSPEALAAEQKKFDELLDTMTPEEREKAEAARAQREALQQMTPEERQQAMAQLQPDSNLQDRMQHRMLAGLLDTTPEQRVQRSQARLQRQAQRGR